MSISASTRHTPILIAHRGASGHRPEHTLASYELAARMGADYLEPDVVSTADGVLVCRHENDVSGTTDVAAHAEFADRRVTKVIDGKEVTGWFTEDFTLAELRTLRAVERLPQLRAGNTSYDGRVTVPTLAEVLELRARLSAELDRPIGVYVETKHPTYFEQAGLPLEDPLAADLRAAGLGEVTCDDAFPLVYLQCFEHGSLHRLRHELGLGAPRIFLVEHPAPGLFTAAGLQDLASRVEGIGPDKALVMDWSQEDGGARPADWLAHARSLGLHVHPWTFRSENAFLPGALRGPGGPADHGRVVEEMLTHLRAGVDGLFTDHPDLGVQALRTFAAG
ncbi:glycerophosphodiester phosphodiesterase family protein [Ornithinicoccus hortensis]|uniref:glycerophosphodiester phosphodiesterase family protein n=1 Tax=Ornithinicoccus hortensis TaxID=82346 RepID=UPI001E38E7E6|nr:glycerophosphodiester phosphodiesterase family protein [Ornithinicoccus hortensis]